MKRIFLDANVLVAIGLRPNGDYSHILLLKNIAFVTSEHILSEVTENLIELDQNPVALISRLRKMMEVTNQFAKLPAGLPLGDDEDRQALAEAIGSECDEFVTFNSRDFNALFGQTVLGVLVRHSSDFVRTYLQVT